MNITLLSVNEMSYFDVIDKNKCTYQISKILFNQIDIINEKYVNTLLTIYSINVFTTIVYINIIFGVMLKAIKFKNVYVFWIFFLFISHCLKAENERVITLYHTFPMSIKIYFLHYMFWNIFEYFSSAYIQNENRI